MAEITVIPASHETACSVHTCTNVIKADDPLYLIGTSKGTYKFCEEHAKKYAKRKRLEIPEFVSPEIKEMAEKISEQVNSKTEKEIKPKVGKPKTKTQEPDFTLSDEKTRTAWELREQAKKYSIADLREFALEAKIPKKYAHGGNKVEIIKQIISKANPDVVYSTKFVRWYDSLPEIFFTSMGFDSDDLNTTKTSEPHKVSEPQTDEEIMQGDNKVIKDNLRKSREDKKVLASDDNQLYNIVIEATVLNLKYDLFEKIKAIAEENGMEITFNKINTRAL